MDESLPELGDLEREVMQLVWAHGSVTAEAVRGRLKRPLKRIHGAHCAAPTGG